ncbi:MAG: DoxX family protein [Bacteroidota bacterium]
MYPVKKKSLFIMSALYTITGTMHFIHPEFYLRIMPPWIPMHEEMVFISGVCEIVFAILLLFPFTRRLAAWCIIGLLVAVFPANIQMTINYFREHNPGLWITIVRLPIQVVLILWAYKFTRADNRVRTTSQ